MDAAVPVFREDEAPPESGVRPRVVSIVLARPRVAPDRDVLADVAEEVFLEVWGMVRTLSPLQGPWMTLGAGQLGAAALTMTTWRCDPGRRPARTLRERWPELVPGYMAMGCLVRWMVDRLCD